MIMARKGLEFLTKLGVVLLHIAAAFLLLLLGLVYLVRLTGVVEVAAIVALFISLPVLIVGVLYLSFDGYGRIPPVGWVGVVMMLVTGVFLIGVILVF